MWPASTRSLLRRLPTRGFSLIELMVVIALIAVLMSIAVPSFRSYMVSSQLSTLANEWTMGTMYARSEAISKNRCVTMCMSTDSQAESPTCATSGSDWNVGWIIFANQKCDSNPSDATAELLKVYMGKPDGATMQRGSGPAIRSIRWDSRGMPPLGAAAEYRLAPAGATWTKIICFSQAGRARVVDGAASCSESL